MYNPTMQVRIKLQACLPPAWLASGVQMRQPINFYLIYSTLQNSITFAFISLFRNFRIIFIYDDLHLAA